MQLGIAVKGCFPTHRALLTFVRGETQRRSRKTGRGMRQASPPGGLASQCRVCRASAAGRHRSRLHGLERLGRHRSRLPGWAAPRGVPDTPWRGDRHPGRGGQRAQRLAERRKHLPEDACRTGVRAAALPEVIHGGVVPESGALGTAQTPSGQPPWRTLGRGHATEGCTAAKGARRSSVSPRSPSGETVT